MVKRHGKNIITEQNRQQFHQSKPYEIISKNVLKNQTNDNTEFKIILKLYLVDKYILGHNIFFHCHP